MTKIESDHYHVKAAGSWQFRLCPWLSGTLAPLGVPSLPVCSFHLQVCFQVECGCWSSSHPVYVAQWKWRKEDGHIILQALSVSHSSSFPICQGNGKIKLMGVLLPGVTETADSKSDRMSIWRVWRGDDWHNTKEALCHFQCESFHLQ